MAAEEAKKVEVEAAPEPEVAPPAVPAPEPEAPAKDVTEEKAVVPAEEEKEAVEDSKALVPVEKIADEPASEKPADEKPAHGGSNDRDIALTRVETEKRNSLIKAWEENEKTKAENKYSTSIHS